MIWSLMQAITNHTKLKLKTRCTHTDVFNTLHGTYSTTNNICKQPADKKARADYKIPLQCQERWFSK